MDILTPDQRLRVFVSSTLQELSEERSAAARAIRALRLAPVMFELGARPHPPRNLYRAYLEQSHIFLGIYWERYGWVAPEMDVSGLEDEYLLSGELPKLIYVKRPADDRDPELERLLDRIGADDRASYKSFQTAEELEGLIQDDLAILLTERFYAVEAETNATNGSPEAAPLPLQPTKFIGREHEIDEVEETLKRPDVRMVTLLGPGGIGKTRLAIEVARRLQDEFADGVRFVALSALREPNQLANYLVDSLGIKENTADALGSIVRWLGDKRSLLVLDNFEQLLDASNVVADILEAAPDLNILVTSRAVLRIRGEHEYPVPPLSLPQDVEGRLSRSDAVTLFMERARDVKPEIEMHGPTAAVVAEIARRLDGLPLAIELAAARLKVLTPEELLRRLGRRLDLLRGGARDLPERQQTLRATIDWSYQLLNEDEKTLFARLSAFRRGATLEAIEQICVPDGDIDVLEGVASLIDKSLLRQEVTPTGAARFWMLETIREFAVDALGVSGEADTVRARHAAFFAALCLEAERGTTGADQQEWFAGIELEWPNIRIAADYLLRQHDFATVAEMSWSLALFTWVRSHMADARRAAEYILEQPGLDERTRAYALGAGGAATFWQGDIGASIPMMAQAHDLFEKLEDDRGRAETLLVLGMVAPEIEGAEAAKERLVEAIYIFERLHEEGWLALAYTAYCWTLMLMDEYEAHNDTFERSVALSRSLGAELTLGMSLGNLGQMRRWQGRLDEAITLEVDAIAPLLTAGHLGAIGYTFVNAAYVVFEMGDSHRAAMMMGASRAVIEKLEVLELTLMQKRKDRLEARLRERLGDDAYEAAFNEGYRLSIEEGVRLLKDAVPARTV